MFLGGGGGGVEEQLAEIGKDLKSKNVSMTDDSADLGVKI